MRHLLFVLLSLSPLGCERIDLKRMREQPSYRPFEADPRSSSGGVMREPPAGTVPRSRTLGPPELVEGRVDDTFVVDVPIELDRAVLERGRERYGVFCSPCHGHAGDGRSRVASSMELRRPPSLVAGAIRDYPAGRVYAVVTQGYGVMPSYAAELPLADRWAVVAYVQALQLSQAVALDALPADVANEAEAWLR